MGTIAILIIGLVLGAAAFLILFTKGYLDGILNLRQQAPQIQNSDITDSVINIKVRNQIIDPEQVLYDEYDKRCAEIDKLHEKRRADYYKKKQDADNVYSKNQEVYYREKQKTQDLASNTKGKSDNVYYAKQKAEESTYQSAVGVINAAKKKETIELLTEEQHIKFKKFL